MRKKFLPRKWKKKQNITKELCYLFSITEHCIVVVLNLLQDVVSSK